MNIYIQTQGARIVREGRHLLVKKGEDTYHTLFVEKLRQVVLFGNVEITPPGQIPVAPARGGYHLLYPGWPLSRPLCHPRAEKRHAQKAAIYPARRPDLRP